VVAVTVVVTPWAVRNDRLFGHVVAISTNTGDNLCIGFHPGALGGFNQDAVCDTGEFWTDGPAAEYRRDREARSVAMEWIRSDPGALPALSWWKIYYTFRNDEDGLAGIEGYGTDTVLTPGWRTAWLLLANSVYGLIMLSMVVGLVVRSRRALTERNPGVLTAAALTVSGILLPVLFFGDPRFKVPATPLFAIFAATTVVATWERLRVRKTSSPQEAS
jgi:hypothetical protein